MNQIDKANLEFIKLLNQMTREQKDICALSHNFNFAILTQQQINRGEKVGRHDMDILRQVKKLIAKHGFECEMLKQEPLGAEFKKVLDDNLWDLYGS